jgi:hypothetical protein
MANATVDHGHVQKADTESVYRDFKEAVNMTASALEKWLATDESREVGWKGEGGHDDGKESVGHESGRRIVELLHKKKADLTDEDYAHMRKVVGYVHRHLAQRPDGDTAHTRWAYSLKNWGRDPSQG